MTRLAVLSLSFALAAAAFTCSAQAAEGNGLFVRAEVGKSNYSVADSGFYQDSSKLFDTTHASSYSVRGGYYFNANWAVEGFVGKTGKTSNSTQYPEVTIHASHGNSSYGIGIVGKKSLGDAHQGFFIGGRAGMATASDKIDYHFSGRDGSEAKYRVSSVESSLYVGANAGYDFNRHVGLSLNIDYRRHKLFQQSARTMTASLALEYRF